MEQYVESPYVEDPIKFEVVKPKLRMKSYYPFWILIGLLLAYYLFKVLGIGSISRLFTNPGRFFLNMLIFFSIRGLIIFILFCIIAGILSSLGLSGPLFKLLFKLVDFFFDFSKNSAPIEKIASQSIEKLPADKITENMDLIRKKESENYTHTEVPEIKEVYISSDMQYQFLQKEFDEILDGMKNRIRQSTIIGQTHFLRSKIEEEDISMEDIIHTAIEHMGYRESKYDLSSIKSSQNYDQLINRIKPYIEEKVHVKSIKEDLQDPYTYLFNDLIEQIRAQLGGSWKGFVGEQRVSEHLELYRDILINIPNVRFEVEDTTVEADNIIITDKGVFCIETKNYGKEGETIVVTKDGLWKRYKGEHEVPIKNVTEQHNRHVGIMQRLVNNELKKLGFDLPYICFEDIYVIANNEVAIDNMSDLRVVRPSNIYNQIRNTNTNNVLSKEVQQVICKIIEDNKMDLKSYPVKSYKEHFLFFFDILISWVENKYRIYDFIDLYIDSIISLGKKICLYETGTVNSYGTAKPIRYICIE